MEAQENSQPEQNVQPPKKPELALVSRSTYIKEKALQWIFFACAFLAVVTVILNFVFTTYSALPVFTDKVFVVFFCFLLSLAFRGRLPRATTASCRCLLARGW